MRKIILSSMSSALTGNLLSFSFSRCHRYAQSEKSVIDAKRDSAAAERRLREAGRERELLQGKVNHLVQERNRQSAQMEAKVGTARAPIWRPR